MSRIVLAVTDLTDRSDATLVWADAAAAVYGWTLHVAHAVELADRELARTGDDLHQVHHAIVAADAAARAQLQRTIGERAADAERVIDLDGVVSAMMRRAAVLQPELMVVPRSILTDCDTAEQAGLLSWLRETTVPVLVLPPSARRPPAAGNGAAAPDRTAAKREARRLPARSA